MKNNFNPKNKEESSLVKTQTTLVFRAGMSKANEPSIKKQQKKRRKNTDRGGFFSMQEIIKENPPQKPYRDENLFPAKEEEDGVIMCAQCVLICI